MKHILSIIITIFSASISAQNVVNIWDGVPLYSVENAEYTEGVITLKNGAERIVRVTTPTLEIFTPKSKTENSPAVVVCPGGGYARLCYDKEGVEIAKWLAENGFVAAVLKYRLPSDAIMSRRPFGPLSDARQAVRYLRQNANKYGVDNKKIGIMGFSAGGHLAGSAATLTIDTLGSARPDFAALIYPVISFDKQITHAGTRQCLIAGLPDEAELANLFSLDTQVGMDMPPVFIACAFDDTAVPCYNSLRFADAMARNKQLCELHVYSKGGHGFGLGTDRPAGEWTKNFITWFSHFVADK
ncbi:MAG: alpha/beta hydrolase [Bacteroidales bacterium]|jgi:acetyl esterase/lipase|nr:alpha/beta hydrolase [Bacteroidales bacterium]